MSKFFVTGGSRGIGEGIVSHLSSLGHDVVFTYSTNQELANDVVKNCSQNSGKVFATQMHLETRDSIKNAIKEAGNYFQSEIDCLVNNAAIAQEKPFLEITEEDWRRMHDINLMGPFICSQELIPIMIKNGGGKIVNISSIGGQWGGLNQAHYASSKSGLINLTKTIAKIFSKDGIIANCIAIGLVSTDMSADELSREDGKNKISSIPIGRIGKISEVSSLVEYLCSEKSSYINGQCINLNGGMYLS